VVQLDAAMQRPGALAGAVREGVAALHAALDALAGEIDGKRAVGRKRSQSTNIARTMRWHRFFTRTLEVLSTVHAVEVQTGDFGVIATFTGFDLFTVLKRPPDDEAGGGEARSPSPDGDDAAAAAAAGDAAGAEEDL
jgi:hypothetical protein